MWQPWFFPWPVGFLLDATAREKCAHLCVELLWGLTFISLVYCSGTGEMCSSWLSVVGYIVAECPLTEGPFSFPPERFTMGFVSHVPVEHSGVGGLYKETKSLTWTCSFTSQSCKHTWATLLWQAVPLTSPRVAKWVNLLVFVFLGCIPESSIVRGFSFEFLRTLNFHCS